MTKTLEIQLAKGATSTTVKGALMKEMEYKTADTILDELDEEKRKAKLLLDFYEKIINNNDPTLELRRIREAGIVKITDFNEAVLGETLETMSRAMESKRKQEE